jgi:molecular chaperone GrpE (heat shock protein)
MPAPSQQSYTHRLRAQMQSVDVLSFKALCRAANVSDYAVQLLRQGRADQIRSGQLYQLAQVLQTDVTQLLADFSSLAVKPAIAQSSQDLQTEYDRLKSQLETQKESLRQEFQRASLNRLESWMAQFPTAAYAAQQNPEAPAIRLLPLMRPIEQLLNDWGVVAIAAVGEEIPYDPQLHQLMEGQAQSGDRVRVRYVGYRQGETLLMRVKVSPVRPGD